MAHRFGVIDLFAGPGGLGEGFAGLRRDDRHPFDIVISAEKDGAAHATLRLRSFLRACVRETGGLPEAYLDHHGGRTLQPDWEDIHRTLWRHAEREAQQLTLGEASAEEPLNASIDRARRSFDDTVLIGGPPCQAYSLVGRARNRGVAGYSARDDHRHYLFRAYIRVLRRLRPAAFVMENVPGMLSSTVDGKRVFEMLLEDLATLGGRSGHAYALTALSVDSADPGAAGSDDPRRFVVRAEDHGVPQRRWRVIILGVRADVARTAGDRLGAPLLAPMTRTTVAQAIGGLPALRSGLSREDDDPHGWRDTVLSAGEALARSAEGGSHSEALTTALGKLPARLRENRPLARSSSEHGPDSHGGAAALRSFIVGNGLRGLAQHHARAHMRSDLARYLFAATFAEACGRSPKANEFPQALAPAHRNWSTGKFADRFRVQLRDEPATTVTSHISKDGHYYIHPDPVQCRSLTVREAARLQTFPDDYLFLGNRTEQYVQVGNAVPPWLARQIAEGVLSVLDAQPASISSQPSVCSLR